MDVIGSEIGLKMRSAIKAKLTELGCYVDDELPDYVMVMVANKRTRPQMEEDLHLFLSSNTASFVAWLYQVLRKLQEVTITTPPAESRASSNERTSTRSTSKEPKVKEKKTKEKKTKIKEKHKKKNDVAKKSKKKSKEKVHRKKVEKKVHKHKKKLKDSEMIRPNVPPLLMNLERESEPSITDVFAGQILKNHGENLAQAQDMLKEKETNEDVKPVVKEVKRTILPIIDPATISVAAAPAPESSAAPAPAPAPSLPSEPSMPAAITTIEVNKEAEEPQDKLQEINQIEEKIHDLRRKLAKQLSSMSDDEDFLNIRAGPEELLPELADDVFQELSAARAIDVRTPPLGKRVEASPVASQDSSSNSKENAKPVDVVVTQIELCLPKRSVRERLGVREEPKKDLDSKKSEKKEHKRTSENTKDKSRKSSSQNSVRETDSKHSKSSKRTSKESEKSSKNTLEKEASSDKHEPPHKRKSPGSPPRAAPASVVTVRARRPAHVGVRAPASQLLFRAVAEAQKSLLNIPPKMQMEVSSKRPWSRAGEKARLTILVSGARDGRRVLQPRGAPLPALPASPALPPAADAARDDIEVAVKREKSSERASSPAGPGAGGAAPLVTRFINTDYVPALLLDGAEPDAAADADTAIVKRADIHNAKVASEEGPVFLVTLEGLDPNQFLSKKLLSEGIDGGPLISKAAKRRPCSTQNHVTTQHTPKMPDENSDKSDSSRGSDKKRLSDTSEESDTQVIIKPAEPPERRPDEKRRSADRPRDRRKSDDTTSKQSSDDDVMIVKEIKTEKEDSPPAKRRRARSPIVFDVAERAQAKPRARTVSNGSDSNTVVTTPASTKYNSLPSLSAAERKAACRTFPLCRFGPKCLFAHPRCKFAAAWTRRNCMYSHQTPPPPSPPAANPYIASHVVPAPNFKSITAAPAAPSMCKYYPACSNAACHFYHPKPCRFGKACANRHDCNFYHHDTPANKWRSAV